MIILGIDPGSRLTGYGFIKNHANRLQYLDSGCIKVKGDTLPQRLGYIFNRLSELIEQHRPVQMGIESVFMHKNADSALKLGQARGAAICAAHQFDVEVFEYAPREIKLTIVGKGAAQKEQVMHMVTRLLSLKKSLQADEADALATAICHAQHQQMESKTGLPARAIHGKRSLRR